MPSTTKSDVDLAVPDADATPAASSMSGTTIAIWIVIFLILLGGGGFAVWWFLIRTKDDSKDWTKTEKKRRGQDSNRVKSVGSTTEDLKTCMQTCAKSGGVYCNWTKAPSETDNCYCVHQEAIDADPDKSNCQGDDTDYSTGGKDDLPDAKCPA
jgi:hypothetical protein